MFWGAYSFVLLPCVLLFFSTIFHGFIKTYTLLSLHVVVRVTLLASLDFSCVLFWSDYVLASK